MSLIIFEVKSKSISVISIKNFEIPRYGPCFWRIDILDIISPSFRPISVAKKMVDENCNIPISHESNIPPTRQNVNKIKSFLTTRTVMELNSNTFFICFVKMARFVPDENLTENISDMWEHFQETTLNSDSYRESVRWFQRKKRRAAKIVKNLPEIKSVDKIVLLEKERRDLKWKSKNYRNRTRTWGNI